MASQIQIHTWAASSDPKTSGTYVGDLWDETDTGRRYAWDGTGWVFQGLYQDQDARFRALPSSYPGPLLAAILDCLTTLLTETRAVRRDLNQALGQATLPADPALPGVQIS